MRIKWAVCGWVYNALKGIARGLGRDVSIHLCYHPSAYLEVRDGRGLNVRHYPLEKRGSDLNPKSQLINLRMILVSRVCKSLMLPYTV